MSGLSNVLLIFPGILIGLFAAAPIGPVNLICIRRTLQFGFLNGFLSGLGAAMGDGLFAVVTGFGLTAISQWITGLSAPLQVAGGMLLLCFGLYTYLSKPPKRLDPATEASDKSSRTLIRAMASTFALTIANPATLLGFTAMFTGFSGLSGDHPSFFSAAFVVGGVLMGSALWWLILTTVVGLLHARIDDRVMLVINHGSGLVVAAFGIAVLAHVGGLF
jgi:threonine/homoserine/homoserine lactone efflux protein